LRERDPESFQLVNQARLKRFNEGVSGKNKAKKFMKFGDFDR